MSRCPSSCYMIREHDKARILYRCFRERGECKGRRHANGIAADAGSWTTREGLISLSYLARDLVATLPSRVRSS